jgi:pimeloyl-ACP methyl ester carboxylesterase
MPIANVNGIELYFEEQGSGDAVLLIPASWWPSDTWKVGVVPVLSRRYRTIIFDCRGTGRSSKPADGYTVKQFAADARGLLNHLGITRCHVVGFALGSLIVQAMAIGRPDLVATLTMAAAGPGSKRLDGGQRDLSPETMREIGKMGFEQYIRSHIDNTVWRMILTFTASIVILPRLSRMLCGPDNLPWKSSVFMKRRDSVGTRWSKRER